MALSDAQQCNATAKSTGERCNNPAVSGSTKCRLHGGKSLSGLAHPRAKTLRRSKYLPMKLVEAYEDAHDRGTRELIEDNIHTREALLSEALKALDDGGLSERATRDMDKLIQQLIQQLAQQPDMSIIDHLVSRIQETNDSIKRYMDAVRTVNTLLDAQSKDLERRAKIEMNEAQTINIKQLGALFQSIRASMDKNIEDPRQRRAVLQDVTDSFKIIRAG